MFETLAAAPPDKILALMGLFAADPRPGKIDLGVGVYKDESGRTPIFRAIKTVERRLIEAQDTKGYIAPAGDPGFNAGMLRLVLGAERVSERTRAVQAPGGAGALRLLCGLIARAKPGATVWHSAETWVNHPFLATESGLTPRPHPWLDPVTGDVMFEAMIDALKAAPAGDVVLLHGCCHNPTGAGLSPAQWRTLADLFVARGLIALIDIAYQGFGEGLDADAYGVRLFAETQPEVLIASSCSKNFGLYRERTGCAIIVGKSAANADAMVSQLLVGARTSYSMPPAHGGTLVRMVFDDAALFADWKAELETMRVRMVDLRRQLADRLRLRTNTARYDFLTRHQGMFSLLGLTDDEVTRLREEHAVYVVSGGRISIPGLSPQNIPPLVDALLAVRGGK